jgi:hypothetical protein
MGRVSIRFPPVGGDADSIIRGLIDAASRAGELTVVSSDKALYSYAKTRGARALRAAEWTALVRGSGARPRRGRTEGSEKPDREPDIQGWLERFSRR